MSLEFLETEAMRILRQLTQEYDRIVNPTHWPPLPQRAYFWNSFLSEGESTPVS